MNDKIIYTLGAVWVGIAIVIAFNLAQSERPEQTVGTQVQRSPSAVTRPVMQRTPSRTNSTTDTVSTSVRIGPEDTAVTSVTIKPVKR